MPKFQLHNMHGPTVYIVDNLYDLTTLVQTQDRLNHSNAGYYRLMATFENRNGPPLTFEMVSDKNPNRLWWPHPGADPRRA